MFQRKDLHILEEQYQNLNRARGATINQLILKLDQNLIAQIKTTQEQLLKDYENEWRKAWILRSNFLFKDKTRETHMENLFNRIKSFQADNIIGYIEKLHDEKQYAIEKNANHYSDALEKMRLTLINQLDVPAQQLLRTILDYDIKIDHLIAKMNNKESYNIKLTNLYFNFRA